MRKPLLALALLTALCGQQATAQIRAGKAQKWDVRTAALLRSLERARTTRAAVADTTARFIFTVTDADAVTDSVLAAGGTVVNLGGDMLSVSLPVSRLAGMADMPAVLRISKSRTLRPYLETVRRLTNTDAVQAGTGLETPFTGKGVVVGIIDQGFEYVHPAFRNAEGTRIIASWNRTERNSSPVKGYRGLSDGMSSSGGHATHVTGIAAGSRISGNNYYGMAPEADLVLVPSALGSSEIVEDVQWIKHVADSLGQPWVINMSFGSSYGPHDGTADEDIAIDRYLGAGGIITAAMGNEGGTNTHIAHEFSAAGEEVIFFLDNSAAGELLEENFLDIWGMAADGKAHLEVTPVAYNALTKKVVTLDNTTIAQAGQIEAGINPNNNKESFLCYVSLPTLASVLNITARKNVYLGMKVKALDASAGFHAWTAPSYGEFVRKTTNALTGDDKYLVGQGSASIPRAIAVAASNGASGWTAAADGVQYSYPSYTVTGKMSGYSSPGPSLGTDIKPTVTAPGSTVISALNRYADPDSNGRIDKSGLTLVGAVDDNGNAVSYATANWMKSHFYGVMSGTSMASPAVCGIVALWLQACPTLTPEQVADIIRQTASHDAYTGQAEWAAKSGYGKINAYEGLKLALKLNNATGIAQTMAADSPVTFQKSAQAWHILFNTAESRADVALYGTDGTRAMSRSLTDVRPGDETAVELTSLVPGVYVLRVVTPQAVVSRKVVVSR